MEQFHYIFIICWLQKTYLLNHKDIISDINEELLFPFLQEYKKRNTKYQPRQLVLSTENRLLQRAEHYSIHSFANYFRQHFLNNYRINCDIHVIIIKD